jgi:HEPN domain-containing protein
MPDRSRDWFAQAERDLEVASLAAREGKHEWACFAAQQSAEKAVKAIHLALGQEAWGHVVRELLEELGDAGAGALLDKARVLDSYYLPTRYPNGHPSGASFEHYGRLQSEQAIRYAEEILEFARTHLAKKR